MTVLGDSIAAGWSDPGLTGWAGRVADSLEISLTNLAVPGNTTADVLRSMDDDIRTGGTDVLVIGAGINDLCRWGRPDGPQSTTDQQRADNWDAILDKAAASGAAVIVAGLLPVDESRNDPAEGLYHTNDGIRAANRMIAAKCAARGIEFLDLYDDFARTGVAGKLADAVHPNAAGHDWLAQKLGAAVQAKLQPAPKPAPTMKKGGPKTAL